MSESLCQLSCQLLCLVVAVLVHRAADAICRSRVVPAAAPAGEGER